MKVNMFFAVSLFIVSLFACTGGEEEIVLLGNWTELGAFEGVPRSDAVAFSIGDYGYIGTGYDGNEDERLNDFWRYDAKNDYWTQVSSLPAPARNGAIGFNAGGKGYIATGYDGDTKLKDTWEYNPDSNSWIQKADFGGSGRYGALAFSIDGLGYVGAGYDGNNLKDLWSYSPEEDKWTQRVSIGGKKRKDAVAFVVNGKAYVCMGADNGQYLGDLWEYDPVGDAWNEKREIGKNANTDEAYDDDYEIIGINGVAFGFNGKGYVATGGPGYPSNRVWEYNVDADLWTECTNFEGVPKYEAVCFSVNNMPYVATGRSSGYYMDDVWTFNPDAEHNEND